MIVLFHLPGDVHSQVVVDALNKKGIPHCSFSLEQLPKTAQLAGKIGTIGTEAWLSWNGQSQDLSTITAVFNRAQPFNSPYQTKKTPLEHYIQDEVNTFLDTLPFLTPNAFWLPRPDIQRLANVKFHQLQIAQQVGFKIPETVMGNMPSLADELCQQYTHEQEYLFALKPINRKFFELGLTPIQQIDRAFYEWRHRRTLAQYKETNRWVYEEIRYKNRQYIPTQQFLQKDAGAYISRISSCPVILQSYIPKKLELRIVVVGYKVFACAIHSQEATSKAGRIDYRYYEDEIPHSPYNLPSKVEKACIELVQRLGLHYGAIDMILTPEGEYVFLENNALGSWLWIEKEAELPISEAIADLLIAPPA